MRKLLLIIIALFIAGTLNAQISFGLNFNLTSQPAWGPTGYDYAGYYYLPDIEVYYNVPQHLFYYNQGGRWRHSSSLPPRFRNYDLYNSYKIVVNEKDPWRNHETYRDKYSSMKGRHDQEPIRDSRDSKYFVNRYHPEHNNWLKQQKYDKSIRNNGNNGNKGNDNGRNSEDRKDNNKGRQKNNKDRK
jgi:hypothetical protein